MRISFWFITYNEMSGHSLSLMGGFLSVGVPESFGTAIGEFDLYAHVSRSRPPTKTLERFRERFVNRLKTRPQIWFRRKKRRIEIAYASNLGSAEELQLDGRRQIVSAQTFHTASREIVVTLAMARKRVNPSDDFDFPAFYAHRERRLGELPGSDAEVGTLLDHLRASQRLLP